MKRRNDDTHRKVWIAHHGPIPFDDDGYRHEIHHIDGDSTNNSIDNLIALTIGEHYEIHFWQGDWAACQNIVIRMNITPEKRSQLASEFALRRVLDGTHHFQDPAFIAADSERKSERLKGSGNHMFDKTRAEKTIDKQKATIRQSIEAGTHHTLTDEWADAARVRQIALVEAGTHNFQDPANREAVNAAQREMIDQGTHPFQTGNRLDPNSIAVSCVICRRVTNLPALMKGHRHETPERLPDDAKPPKPQRKVCCIVCGGTTREYRLFIDHCHGD